MIKVEISLIREKEPKEQNDHKVINPCLENYAFSINNQTQI